MKYFQLLSMLEDADNQFRNLTGFINYTEGFLSFIKDGGMQADMVSTHEPIYHFYQYRQEARFAVTRPINMSLFIKYEDFQKCKKIFLYSLEHINEIKNDEEARNNINRFIYTCQQSIGAGYDAFNNPNRARKQNGNLFEILIREVLKAVGLNVSSGVEKIPLEGKDSMSFQHDVILKNNEKETVAIGQIKTSTKDRIDKIFLDKYMYNKVKEVDMPHFAILLNDIQRKGKLPNLSVNGTFLPGHFKAYSIALNPLDGVYYFDLRPIMLEDKFLRTKIKGFDTFLVDDVWKFGTNLLVSGCKS